MNSSDLQGREELSTSSPATKVYVVKVQQTIREVLHLLTRKRAFALLSGSLDVQNSIDNVDTGFCIEICHEAESIDGKNKYLYVGMPVKSRDEKTFRGDLLLSFLNDSKYRPLDENEGIEFSFPTFEQLCDLANEKFLAFYCEAASEAEINKIWQNDMLRLPDPQKRYKSEDFSSIDILIKSISEDPEEDEVDVGGTKSSLIDDSSGQVIFESVDLMEFDAYFELRNRLEGMAKGKLGRGYGDDIFIEYMLESEDTITRYCITEFYSNHNWNIDPVNLLVLRFRCTILPTHCGPDQVRFSHPTKATSRKGHEGLYFLDSLIMKNDIKTKFTRRKPGKESPHEEVSADRTMDNLVDFYSWLDMHQQEIALL